MFFYLSKEFSILLITRLLLLTIELTSIITHKQRSDLFLLFCWYCFRINVPVFLFLYLSNCLVSFHPFITISLIFLTSLTAVIVNEQIKKY